MSDKPENFRALTIFDFQRNLDTIIHSGEREARSRAATAQNEFAAKGLGASGPLIENVIQTVDQIHAGILKRAMELTHEFSSGSGHLSKEDLAKTALQRFESLATMLLSTVPLAGRPEVAQQIRRQYAAVFKQRLDVALKDIEIGFIDGRRVDTHPVPSTTTKLSDAVILKPTIMGMGFDLHKAGLWLKDRPTIMRAGVKLHKAWQWLKGRF
jgi:hypothetical protein